MPMIAVIENRPSRLTPKVINLYFKAHASNSLHTISAIDIAVLRRRLAAFSALGSQLFPKAEVSLPSGKTLTITA
jgi:hypothetical protein